MDILLQEFQTPFGTVPFSKIDTTQFAAAIKVALENARSEVEEIVSQDAAPSFANTIAALDYSGEQL